MNADTNTSQSFIHRVPGFFFLCQFSYQVVVWQDQCGEKIQFLINEHKQHTLRKICLDKKCLLIEICGYFDYANKVKFAERRWMKASLGPFPSRPQDDDDKRSMNTVTKELTSRSHAVLSLHALQYIFLLSSYLQRASGLSANTHQKKLAAKKIDLESVV